MKKKTEKVKRKSSVLPQSAFVKKEPIDQSNSLESYQFSGKSFVFLKLLFILLIKVNCYRFFFYLLLLRFLITNFNLYKYYKNKSLNMLIVIIISC